MGANENGMVEGWKIGMLEKASNIAIRCAGILQPHYSSIPLFHDHIKNLL